MIQIIIIIMCIIGLGLIIKTQLYSTPITVQQQQQQPTTTTILPTTTTTLTPVGGSIDTNPDTDTAQTNTDTVYTDDIGEIQDISITSTTTQQPTSTTTQQPTTTTVQ